MADFSGTLNQNEVYSAIFNMIISQEIFDRVASTGDIVDKARIDGGLYGDSKLFYSGDVLKSHAWLGDLESENLLKLDRPSAPKCQVITMDQFRQIRLTLDDILSKRAFSDENIFGQFSSLMEGMVVKTKEICDATNYNAFIGTAVTSKGKQSPAALTLTSGKEGLEIAQAIADIIDAMTIPSRDYNDYGHVTKFGRGEVKIIWNSKYVNLVNNTQLPGLFNKDIIENVINKGDVLNEIYWGDVKKLSDISAATVVVGKPIKVDDGVYTFEPDASETMVLRCLTEMDLYDVSDTSKETPYHFFAGDELVNPIGKKLVCTDLDKLLYAQNSKIIAKIYVKLPVYMSAFTNGSAFQNPRSLTRNRYLTYGFNKLALFEAYPFVTIKSN